MNLIELIEPASVKSMTGVTSKKRLFQALSLAAAPHCTVRQDVIVQALMDRETLGPTGVGRGVALPHARLETVDQVFGCFAKLDKPIEFNSVDRQPVDLVFALFAPQNSGVQHLKALASVSRTLRDQDICAKLRANDDPGTLFEVLVTEVVTAAAAA